MTNNETPSNNQRKAAQVQSGAARAAILGISDGLVTNTSLILGMTGAEASQVVVRIAGVASLVAGAFSMAVGEYISMKAQAELLGNVLRVEEEAIRKNPEQAEKSLAEIMIEQGVAPDHAALASRDLAKDPEKATMVYARSRLGIDPDELGSPYAAAFASLGTFAMGAFIPLAVWFFAGGSKAVAISLAVATVSAIIVGGFLGKQSGGKWYKVAFRQLLLIALATAVTYAVGRLFHTQIT